MQLERELDPIWRDRPRAEVTAGDSSELSELLRRYYQNPAVRERMYEFLGGADLRTATAVYIAGTDGFADYGDPSSPTCLNEYLEASLEVDRSLWDQTSLIAHIDLEYHNFDCPEAPWLDPERAFKLQQPVLDATLRILGQADVVPLILVSGRGFHLVWAIRRSSRAFNRLVQLGWATPTLQARYVQPCSPAGLTVGPDLGRAFAGLGLIIEFVGQCVLEECVLKESALEESREGCPLPVQLTAIEVGPGTGGREIVSFDLSEYGDPLHGRHIRLPFSAYLKPRQQQWKLGEEAVRRLLPIFEIPLSGMTPAQAITAARNPDTVLELSRHASVRIPDESESMENLLDAYEGSELAAFHDRFYAQLREQVSRPPDPSSKTRSIRIPGAPPCVEWFLEHPNDWLLKPVVLQHIVRVLTALDWTPSAISQLICASYHIDCDWGGIWARLDSSNRAIFYTRLFAGMIATGCDQLIDLNCVSQKEKGYCMIPQCSSNLVTYRNILLDRRPH
jgi:hypothetical protein